MLQLGRHALMESNCACFCAGVVNQGGHRHVGCHTGHGDYMSVVLLDHSGQELLHCQEVGEGVHLEGLANFILGFVKDGKGVTNAGIVDKDGGFAVCLAELCRRRCELGGRCDVDLVVVYTSF